jgi:glycosyltransferase
MKISVVTIAKNASSVIDRNLESVRIQRFHSYEHIIVNKKGSEDLSYFVLRYPHTTYFNVSDLGIYDAMNIGLNNADGDYIIFLNSDDFFIHNSLFSYIEPIVKERSPDIIYGNIKYVDSKVVPFKTNRIWRAGRRPLNWLSLSWMPPHPSTFYKRNIFDHHGGFNNDFKISGDYDFFIRASRSSRLKLFYLDSFFTQVSENGISSNRFKAFIEDVISLNSYTRFPLFFAILKRILKTRQFLL